MKFIFVLIMGINFISGLIFYMWKEAFRNQVNNLELVYKNFPDSLEELKIFFITDVHRRIIADSIINKVKDKADLVIIGGDLTEKNVPINQTRENLRKLKTIGPVYFIWGNNDYEIGEEALLKLFQDEDIKVLENDFDWIENQIGQKLALIGIGETSLERDRLEETLVRVKDARFKIVVCHNPTIVKKIQRDHKIDLLLCGHTHGGQINVFGIAPYPKGKFQSLPETDLLVSNGYGTTLIPLRFGAKAETHLITLKRI